MDPLGLDDWFPIGPGALPPGAIDEKDIEVLIVIVSGTAIAIDVATFPTGEGPLIAGGLRQCFKKLCQSKAKREAAEKAAAGLRRELAEHKQKLWDYVRDPLSHDNKGHLAEALRSGAPPERIRSIVEGRIRKLQGQIDNFQRQIDQIMGCF